VYSWDWFVITSALSGEGYLIAGVPAKPVKELSEEDKFLIERRRVSTCRTISSFNRRLGALIS